MYSLYGIMYSDYDKREGLLGTYHLDTTISIEFTNCYHFRSFK